MHGQRKLIMNKWHIHNLPILFHKKDTEQKICKLVYKTLVKNKIPTSPNRAMTHWQDTFDEKELQWKQIFTCPYTLTIDKIFVLFNTNTY